MGDVYTRDMSRNVFGALLIAVVVSSFACTEHQVKEDKSPVAPTVAREQPEDAGMPLRTVDEKDLWSWKQIDELVDQQKFQEALTHVQDRLDYARAHGDEAEWTRALIRATQLRIGLHGYETQVRTLMEYPWPKGAQHRAILDLYYAQTLVEYVHAYQWEIRQREKVESTEKVDLKRWTTDQLYAEIQRAYQDVWNQREQLGAEPVDALKEYIEPNNYPKDIRDTLRDAVSYLRVIALADTTGWRPEQQNELYRLDWAALVRAEPSFVQKVDLTDPNVHPLVKIAAVLGDLQHWHQSRGEKGAALEAYLERLQRLHDADAEKDRRALVRKSLEATLPEYADVPWWSMGMATLAEFQRQAGMLVKAHATAAQGQQKYRESVGGQRCLSLEAGIEAPEFTLQSMTQDSAQKRSLMVEAKNLPTLYFRAYPIDLAARLRTARDYNLLPSGEELRKYTSGKPAAEWTVQLPATPDYETHRTFVTPPMTKKGLYAILASAKPDFRRTENRLLAVNFLLSDLSLVSRTFPDGSVEVTVLSATGGEPVSGCDVSLYEFDYEQGHHPAETRRTGADGRVRFESNGQRRYHEFFLLARKGDDAALDAQGIYFNEGEQQRSAKASLIYTDRSIYRPNQKLFWKVISFDGNAAQARFHVLPQATVTVKLLDGNGQEVDSKQVKTNAYGSAAGEFTLPAGRMLGAWSLRADPQGWARIQVEEYKRPTFEAELKDPSGALRLNKPATVKGTARYYFGLPVVTGNVRWSVTRVPVYPFWWGWWWPGRSESLQVIATGTSTLNENGEFEIHFTPEAEEPKTEDERAISFRYQVSADVTDEGGETRSATKQFRLGWVSVEARVDSDDRFFVAGAPEAFTLRRSDLNGTPREGKGSWRVLSLQQPQTPSMPAELAPQEKRPEPAEGQPKVVTPGDTVRPRWETQYDLQSLLAQWKDGAEQARGQVQHDEKGETRLSVPALKAGAYRIRYSTVDDFGQTFETFRDFVVAADKTPLAVPAALIVQSTSAKVGGSAKVFVTTGFTGQPAFLDVYRAGKRISRRELRGGRDPEVIALPITDDDRGGFTLTLTLVRDDQLISESENVYVPWDDKELKVEFATFRDKIRPGAKETFTVTVKSPTGANVGAGAAELLAYMYDESLDAFVPHSPPSPVSLYPSRVGAPWLRGSFSETSAQWLSTSDFVHVPPAPQLTPDSLRFYDSYAIGGPGYRRGAYGYGMGPTGGGLVMRKSAALAMPSAPPEMAKKAAKDEVATAQPVAKNAQASTGQAAPASEQPLRQNFAETAFWEPHLLTNADGSASIQFTVPDSVTGWNVWVHAVTKDLRGGSVSKKTRSVKELMVRPYLPRFLREGDQAAIKVVVNNASERPLAGKVTFDIVDPDTQQSVLQEFGLDPKQAVAAFNAAPGKGANVSFPIVAPKRPGNVAFRVVATSGDLSDGELRPLPILPSRVHLVQSRFVTLKGPSKKTMTFDDLARNDDPTLITDQLVVNVDAQLFYSVLDALPYLVTYPYECTEQTLNRFLSTGIVSSLYDQYPAVQAMAKKLSTRKTPLEVWDATDPNRKMSLEETPWLELSKGAPLKNPDLGLVNVLDPRIARAERDAAIAKLQKAQTANGAFPWWSGGPPSPYMTLYILHGLSRAAEYQVDVPREMTVRAWGYLAQHFRDEYANRMIKEDCCWEFLTFLNYVASSFPDETYTGNALTMDERKQILDLSFRHWKEHSPLLKGYLALTLKRMGREKDAQLVWASVMDSAKTTEEQGTFWAPEDRSWLWYNDTTETHAFALRTLMELSPNDERRHGLVQWLLMDKKLNHWKSTRATAEVIYSLTKYLEKEGALGIREDATVTVGPKQYHFEFQPDEFTGKKNQIVIPGEQVDPKSMSRITVEKTSKGMEFASAAWSFSTEQLPKEERGDFFEVTRTYFKREKSGNQTVLRPLSEGARLELGDEVEVQLSLRTKHAAEYVHLRDPRAAGLEPENAISRFKWQTGLGYYEEIRDSGTNFFFEWLPVGEYTFKYRLRVNMAGTFRVGPATVQSMYAPEFNAYSAGNVLSVQ